MCGLDKCGSGQGPVLDCCECGNDPSDSIKGGEFHDELSDCSLLKEGATLLRLKYLHVRLHKVGRWALS
jgi:hypothetical protein